MLSKRLQPWLAVFSASLVLLTAAPSSAQQRPAERQTSDEKTSDEPSDDVSEDQAGEPEPVTIEGTDERPYESVPELPPEPPPRDRFNLRLGFVNSALFDSNQGRPFFYFDFGLRYKTSENYIDLKLPAFVAGIDFLSHQLQTLIGVNEPFNLFEWANDPIHYAAFLEPGHVRLGQTYSTTFPGGAPLRLTAGVFTLVDFVFFDLAIANRDPEEFRDINDPSATDPFVLAPGGFIAIGGDAPISEWDLAVGIGPDVYQDDSYVPSNGIVFYADLEVQIDPLKKMGTYVRTRLSTYTHESKLLWTIVASYGIALSLL